MSHDCQHGHRSCADKLGGLCRRQPVPHERRGCVIRFKAGVSDQAARLALHSIKGVLDGTPHVRTFDPEFGEPVWYIP